MQALKPWKITKIGGFLWSLQPVISKSVLYRKCTQASMAGIFSWCLLRIKTTFSKASSGTLIGDTQAKYTPIELLIITRRKKKWLKDALKGAQLVTESQLCGWVKKFEKVLNSIILEMRGNRCSKWEYCSERESRIGESEERISRFVFANHSK